MKKFALMLALACPLAFTSCGDDNEDAVVSLDKTSTEIVYNATQKLTPSEKGGTWGSSNEFVATVNSDGTVTANHVGTAVINYTKDGSTASCRVTVNPLYTNYFLPVMKWGASIQAVKEAVPSSLTKVIENETALSYDTNGTYPIYSYTFSNSGLANSSITIQGKDDDEFTKFFEQYFKYIAEDEDGMSLVYADANNLTEATNALVYTPFDFDSEGVPATLMAIFSKVQHTTKGAAYVVDKAAIEAHKNIVREVLKK